MPRIFPVGSIISLPEFRRMKFVVAGKYVGAMGEVLHLQPIDPLWPDCALKTVLDNGDWKAAEREARYWIALGRHKGIAQALWAGHWESQPAILSLWYARTAAEIRPGDWTKQLLERFICDLVDGLEFASSRFGLVHRDIKPANILLDQDNAPRLADFGLALSAPRAKHPLLGLSDVNLGMSVSISQSGAAGTPLYMAPEIFGGAPASFGTDIYALGVTLFELLTGEHPYIGPETAMRFRPIPRDRPLRKALQRIAPSRSGFETLILRSVSLNPRDRPASYAEVMALGGLSFLADIGQSVHVVKNQHPDATAIVGVATALRNQGHMEQARKILSDARAKVANDALLLNAAAAVEFRAGLQEEAIRLWHQAAQTLREANGIYAGNVYPDPIINLGRQLILRNEFSRAAQWLLLARGYLLQHRPGMLDAFAEFGWLRLYEGDSMTALRLLSAYASSTQCDEHTLNWWLLSALLAKSLQGSAHEIARSIGSLGMSSAGVALVACLVASYLPLDLGRTMVDRAWRSNQLVLRQILDDEHLGSEALGPPIDPLLARSIAVTLDLLVTGGRSHELLGSI